MMFSGQKSSFISLVHRTGILRKQFNWSSLFNTEFTKKFKKEGEFDLYHTYCLIALIMPITLWRAFFTVYIPCKLFENITATSFNLKGV